VPTKRIVVGVDGSPGARSALLWAADEARLRAVGLFVVHAPEPADAAVDAQGQAGSRFIDVVDRLLRAQATLASARQPAVPVTMLFSPAPAADALIEQSRDADLVVVGTRGRGGITMSLLGSVSYRVAAHAGCPVVVVPEQPTDTTDGDRQRIVVGVSSGPAGRAALEFAFEEARYRGATVHAVRAAEPDAATDLEADLAELRKQAGEIPVETTMIHSELADVLIRASHRAQLVVVGCHHSEDRWSTRLGAVPAAIVHRTSCPVVVTGATSRRSAHHERRVAAHR
jgi:nucleotide-binding universal stress UspA family protein